MSRFRATLRPSLAPLYGIVLAAVLLVAGVAVSARLDLAQKFGAAGLVVLAAGVAIGRMYDDDEDDEGDDTDEPQE